MSDTERRSPRTAIRNWLQDTHSTSTIKPADAYSEQQDVERGSKHRSRRHLSTKYLSETTHRHDEEACRKHQRHNKSGTRQKHGTDQVLTVSLHQPQPQIYSKVNTAVDPNGIGLAERLGLHAPFRTFKDHSDNDIIGVQGRPRKRRRSRSSTSSYLEPAAANDLSDNDHDRPSPATKLCTARTGPGLGDRCKNISPTASQGSQIMLPSPEKLLKSYERRPRHKTRQDRYELKDNNRDGEKTEQAAKKNRVEKKQKKHKRREKSGAALMHDFTAHNVAHDRLTLKPTKTLGLFGKGRASSPVKRRGLPDLAFSEMTFLTSRREKPKDSLEDRSTMPPDKKKQRKSAKAVDTEAEISRYFTSAKPTSLNVTSPHAQRYQRDRRHSRDHESPQAFVNLPDRPFLGFGSCGPNTSISPTKTPVKTNSRGLGLRDTRSPTRSASDLAWSQSEGQSYPSRRPDRRHHVEPLALSNMSKRKRNSPTPHKGQHSTPPVSPPCVPTTFSGAQGAACRPSSKQENASEAPGQSSGSRSATRERLRPREKSENYGDTGIVEFDAAKMIPQDIEYSVRENTLPAEASGHGGPESALLPRNQAACQSSGYEPQCEPRAHDARPLLSQMPILSPHENPLDDILEALLRECNTKFAGSGPVCCTTLIQHNFLDSEEARVPDRSKQHSRMPAHAYVESVYTPEVPASASNPSRKPRSACLQQASPHNSSKSTHELSMGGLNSSNRPNLGYTPSYRSIPTRNQVDSSNAWNSYDNLYERQQEQADLTPDSSREHISPYTAVQDDLSGPSQETDHGVRTTDYTPGLHCVEASADLDDHRPYLYETLQESNENDDYQEIRHSEWAGQYFDHGASYDSGASIFDDSHEGFENRIMAPNCANDYQKGEPSFVRGADPNAIEHQLFTTNIPDTHSSWRPHYILGSNYGLESCAADAQVQDVDPALSGFWTPHKLY